MTDGSTPTGDDRDREGDDRDGEKREEVVRARGHRNVAATHETTFEVTTDDWLTPAGDCILGVEADRAPADFEEAFVAACRDADARIVATVRVGDPDDPVDAPLAEPAHEFRVEGRGDPDLDFDGDRSIVCRTSDYVDDRTVMVGADRAAADLDRAAAEALSAGAPLELRLRVE